MNKKIIIIVLAIILVVAVCIAILLMLRNNNINEESTNTTEKTISQNKNIVNTNNEITESNNVEDDSIYFTGTHHATINVKDYGIIELELDSDTAPLTVSNFAKLANEGFYDGLTFHRIIDGFMIQGGDPLGNGTGGSSENIKGEFKANGVDNNISHKRGVISMARSNNYNSASSQFFIVHKDSTFLDGQYAGFGYVTKGIEIVDEICKDTKVEDSNGTVLKENQPVIESITMND